MAIDFVGFTSDRRIVGTIPLADDRLSDMLNSVARVVIRDAEVEDVDTGPEEGGDVMVPCGELLVVGLEDMLVAKGYIAAEEVAACGRKAAPGCCEFVFPRRNRHCGHRGKTEALRRCALGTSFRHRRPGAGSQRGRAHRDARRYRPFPRRGPRGPHLDDQ